MKLIFLILISFNSFAGNFFPVGKEGAKTTYFKKSDCEKKELFDCFDVTNKNVNYHDIKEVNVEVTDIENPVYAKNQDAESCSSDSDCDELIFKRNNNKFCEKNGIGYFPMRKNDMIICAKIEGYGKKTIKANELVVNESKKQSFEDAKLIEYQTKLSVAKEIENQYFGKEMYALVKVVQKKKGLTKSQRKSIRQSFKELKSMLLDGDIDLAQDELNTVTPDGVLVSQEEIDLLKLRIKEYLEK